ncbi:TPA: HlyC/CorC family transporter [Candidatus Scatousia excrementigallinarum]|uniref:HlyC/CorC family transporter n=1 Tax=Candidatus Scatousia excrementigallinarum TaxID=2840935 RepID=A0A9D1EZ92_9BACT|nr:HlyC/CorC family transporter [Candidatus Scatousia excrementigallinarum]
MDETGNIAFNLFVIIFLLFSNGFFVASEFAMVKVRKTRIEQLVKEGNFNAKIALEALKDLDKFIAAVQLGVTISSIGLGWVGEGTLARIIEPLFSFLPGISQNIATHTVSVSISFALITFLHVVIGELVPKSIALEYTEKTALVVARPMQIITTIFNPFIWLLNGFGNSLLQMFHIPHSHKGSLVHSTEELDMLVNASYNGGVLNETEKDMLHNVFKFSDLTAKQVMIPRTDMVCIPEDMSFEDLNNLAAESQYTRYPVYSEDIDHITGLIHVKDLYSLSIKNQERPIKSLLREVLLVPETITMDNLVLEFKKRKGQMAIVVDEFGGTSGLITLEDVLEEIFGEVQDEFDEEEECDIREIEPNKYIANAMMRLDELAEFFEIPEDAIDDEDIDTIGGLVVKLLGRIANVGDTVQFENLTFNVKEIDGARITKLEIIRKPVEVEEKEEEHTK